MSITSERLILAIDSQPQIIGGSLQLLKKADIPIRSLNESPFIWFDSNTNALKRPDNRGQALLEVMFLPKRVALNAIMDGRVDFGLLGGDMDPSLLSLTATQPISEELRKTETLRGIEGFRDRLAVKLIRAARELIADTMQRQKRRQKLILRWQSYAEWIDTRTF